MKKYGQKALAVLLCVCVVFSCMTVPAAALTEDDVLDAIWDILTSSSALDRFAQALEYNAAEDILSQVYQDVTGRTQKYNIVRPSKRATTYAQVLKDNLSALASDWNNTYRNYNGIAWTVRTASTTINGESCWVIAINVPKSEFVLNTGYDTWFLCDGFGNVLYATKDDSVSSANRWVPKSSIGSQYYLLSYEDLNNLALKESGTIRKSGDYYIITGPLGTNILVNPDGYPYAAIAQKDSAAVNQDRPTSSGSVTENNTTNNFISNEYIDEGDTIYQYDGDTYNEITYNDYITNEGDEYTYYIREGDKYIQIVDNSQDIDIENMTQVQPGGTLNQIENLIYDENTKTYYVDSHDVTNNTTNYFIYQYHINYTSVTYIGQTEEYDKYYELYYQLPDGRDSADLTAEELEQLNLSIDVIPYGRSADDTSLRSLYHFDGDTSDASYWNYATAFTWNKGASLTYMDAGVFNGALYLDETEHDFTLTLPSNIASSDFTLQFRYYQSYTAAPVTDSYIMSGSAYLMRMNGSDYMNRSSTVYATMPVGTWNEIALIRSDGKLYYYLNGVSVGSVSDSTVYGSELTFHFGSEQQTYKYFDELRFLNYALRTGGANYTPTAVPHDTNLALVLPDSAFPVADEYWSFENNQENLIADKYANMYEWTASTLGTWQHSGGNTELRKFYQGEDHYPDFYYRSTFTNFVNDGTATYLTSKVDSNYIRCYVWKNNGTSSSVSSTAVVPAVGVIANVGQYQATGGSQCIFNYLDFGTYTFSLVNKSGEIASVTFNHDGSNTGGGMVRAFGYEFGLHVAVFNSYNPTTLCIMPISDNPDGLVYMELVKGSSTNLKAEWVESVIVMDKEDLNTPTLAARTDVTITSHQIGGVRPSVPSKGMVYAMVESGYITSLQVYNGSAWEGIDGRIWTGSRWIPASSYNVITLQDMYDIADATLDYEYIYTESGFWDWFQRAWKDLISRLDKIIEGQGGGGGGGSGGLASDCQHVYDSEIDKEATCTEPGHKVYTCSTCGHQYTELLDALGHDWIVTNTVPDVLDEEGNLVEEGYDELTCSRCELTAKDYGEGPMETDLFEAIGDLIAGGISWVLDKLTELVNALTGITETFNSFVERVGALAGTFPLFFAAFFALIPEDLATVLWFGVVAFVVMAVWRKWSK